MRKFWPAVVSALLIASCCIPFYPIAIFFCFIPIWKKALNQDSKFTEIVSSALIVQFLATVIVNMWVFFSIWDYLKISWWMAALIFCVFGLFAYGYIGVSIVCIWLLKRRTKNNLLSLVAGAAVLNLGECFWPTVFRWNFGYNLFWANSSISQFADHVGFIGLSFFIYLINAILLLILSLNDRRQILKGIFALSLFIIGLSIAGRFYKYHWQKNLDGLSQEFSVLAVQPNVEHPEILAKNFGQSYQDIMLDKLFTTTRSGINKEKKIDLVVWPENAVPVYLDNVGELDQHYKKLLKFSRDLSLPILTGAYSREGEKEYNGLYLIDKTGQVLGKPYHKKDLLMFGEYLPWQPEKSLSRGQDWGLLQLSDVKLAVQICYEGLNTHNIIEQMRSDVNLIVNVTNDSWFGNWQAPYQHAYITLAHAIEFRVPVVRVANSGITAVAQIDGTIDSISKLNKEFSHIYKIKTIKQYKKTVYSKYGTYWFFVPIFFFVVTALLLFGFGRLSSFEVSK